MFYVQLLYIADKSTTVSVVVLGSIMLATKCTLIEPKKKNTELTRINFSDLHFIISIPIEILL